MSQVRSPPRDGRAQGLPWHSGRRGFPAAGVDPVRAYAKALTARLAFLPKCGHYPWIEQPEPFVRVLDSWLQDPTAD